MACGRWLWIRGGSKPHYAVGEQCEHKDANAGYDDKKKVMEAIDAFHDGRRRGLKAELPIVSYTFEHDDNDFTGFVSVLLAFFLKLDKMVFMSNETTSKLFFHQGGLEAGETQAIVDSTLGDAHDGELFLEYRLSENLHYDDGRLRVGDFDTRQGFGLRCVVDDASGYAHGSELSYDALSRARSAVVAVKHGHEGVVAMGAPSSTNRHLYSEDNPIEAVPFARKVALLEEVDAFVRAQDSNVRQVRVRLGSSWQAVRIIRAGGDVRSDIRPLVRLDINVVVGRGERIEAGYTGIGGRDSLEQWMREDVWQAQALEALRQAKVNLESVAAPAGEMDVVLAAGWPGILLHEAVGHGLEGDFNRKGTSAFSGMIGKRVASKGVTVVDDGTMEKRRGSLSIDDEGTPSSCTTLIEDGILVGYMHDRMSARRMDSEPTGNGRRESYAHLPMPRMTNTYMHSGEAEPEELLKRVKRGLYACAFGGGQVDITSGKFVFSCTEAYRVEDGKIGAPVKGATLIGNGPDVLTRVSMVGNDMKLDTGIGICGKWGQSVPVGVGQPSMLIEGLTVGGEG